ncbi:hypothetical protein MVEN_01668300 [Mycena venus]|uniref:Cell wall protein n=1 Tax=Mycena venus TaxID=2733690 RepID=A0A8H6XPF1_9AGAR|nr:hypothetical protein MVEN_01668300 [Mycena venus]
MTRVRVLLFCFELFLTTSVTSSQSTEISERTVVEETYSSPNTNLDATRTASNALHFTLQTLHAGTRHLPLGGAVLSSAIEPLLQITTRIKQTAANGHGLAQLAARIERLTPIVCEMAGSNSQKGQSIMQNFQQELRSITEDLDAARTQDKLDQFFNSVDNSSSLQKHNMVLAQMIADSTLVTVDQVLQSLRDLENLILPESPVSDVQIVLGDITGGSGGSGNFGHIGGEGGEGEGPELELDTDLRSRIGNIFGGKGGGGGIGVEVGGKGGAGKGPVISVLRRNRILVAEPEAEEELSIL